MGASGAVGADQQSVHHGRDACRQNRGGVHDYNSKRHDFDDHRRDRAQRSAADRRDDPARTPPARTLPARTPLCTAMRPSVGGRVTEWRYAGRAPLSPHRRVDRCSTGYVTFRADAVLPQSSRVATSHPATQAVEPLSPVSRETLGQLHLDVPVLELRAFSITRTAARR